MRTTSSIWGILLIVLLVPVVPFVALGWWLEPWFVAHFNAESLPRLGGTLAVAALASDILLPIPSSAICAWAGSQYGMWGGTLLCWVGLNLGAMLGFALGRYGGRPLAERLTSVETLRQLEQQRRWAPWLLVVTRPLPILAEATVLLVGIHRLAWSPFLLVSVACNLAVAVLFVGAGFVTAAHDRFWLGLGLVVAVPLAAAWVAQRRWLRSKPREPASAEPLARQRSAEQLSTEQPRDEHRGDDH